MTKIIAFHLPQFHAFPENDEWWGKGFTEWVNVKKARPQYKRHMQPNVPLANYYYDLSDPETRAWQAATAKEYGVYGFCYYHYWFNGKLLMEKPLESFLKEKEIDLPFCFCWANEPWTRAWDGRTSTVIMPQYYGAEKEWQEHIDYLMPFFLDERYIKIENKPMLIIYRTNNISNCNSMIEFWNIECQKQGFDGLHLVEEYNSFQDSAACTFSEAIVDFEPLFQIRRKYTFIDDCEKSMEHIRGKWITGNLKSKLKAFSYESIWKRILREEFHSDKKVYLGGFVNWDNTPRRGGAGTVCLGASPELFEKYLMKLCDKATKMDSEFIFINAWNEWAEGAYLEADEYRGYGYLNAVKKVMSKNGR